MAHVVWPRSILEILESLPPKEQALILDKAERLSRFPRLYLVRACGRFPGCRWFFAGIWLVYYRVTGETVFIRGLWPAGMP